MEKCTPKYFSEAILCEFTWSGYKITGLILCRLPVALATASGVEY
jgi:hypothetical protein